MSEGSGILQGGTLGAAWKGQRELGCARIRLEGRDMEQMAGQGEKVCQRAG